MKYICRNCGEEMTEDEPGILFCHGRNCEQQMMKDDYGFERIIPNITSCWRCPYFYDMIARSCKLTGNGISGGWAIDPTCPLWKVPYEKERNQMDMI